MFNGVQNQEKIVMTKQSLLFLLPFFLFACDESPTAPGDPGDDLVGSWVSISEPFAGDVVIRFEKSGKLMGTVKNGGISISLNGTWSATSEFQTITAGQLIMTVTIDNETEIWESSYSIRGSQLTLLYTDGDVEVYERQ